ncbi:hypothetical protein OBP_216 [Pseudomonas phage OBP]|uniref:hypothetical protein n=1 Tax=Pseudomonas phage OBP TaxID=1124849 RepID=UPI000240D5BC|nr:hypothetical protein OBP_216 [Pseudomonas phage OBP]AEV89653.1 hypothetical protein OBP_216 [Pseudomonas phage OBP]
MKTIIDIIRALFHKLWVSPKHALVVGFILALTNSLFLFSAWIVIYASMYYGHKVALAASDYNDYSRYTPYAEADLRFKDAITPSFFKALAIYAAVFTGNFWLIPVCYLITDNSTCYAYINRGFRYVIVL